MNSSVGLRVNRMMTEPTRPMTADSRLVIVCVSIVRTSVTSLDRRDTSSPTRRLAWKSSDSVTSRPNRSPRSWATTRSPTTPSRYVWRKLPTAWTQNSPNRMTIKRSRPAESPPATTSVVIPAMISGNASPISDEMTRPTSARPNRPQVRAQVPEQPRPRDAAEPADLPDHGAGVGRNAGELSGHCPMMARRPDPGWQRSTRTRGCRQGQVAQANA